MISDNDLYTLANTLGVLSMFLIVGYHYIEVNTVDQEDIKAVEAN